MADQLRNLIIAKLLNFTKSVITAWYKGNVYTE